MGVFWIKGGGMEISLSWVGVVRVERVYIWERVVVFVEDGDTSGVAGEGRMV